MTPCYAAYDVLKASRGEDPWTKPEECYFAKYGAMEHGDPMTPCEGRLVRCHLIEKQELVRRGLDPWDPATWVFGCGGWGYGNEGHHGMFDAYKLDLAFRDLPKETVGYAIENGLESRLRRYR